MLQLTDLEAAWLAGEAGSATRRAMEIVVALGNIYGAERLLPVTSVQISGVSYRNIGAAGLAFLRGWAEEGARVRVPTTLNPTAMDLVSWRVQRFSPDFAEKQQAVVDTFAAMGVGAGNPVPTCTPYLIGSSPGLGEHVAWAESSAVVYANSVLGARTNREGGPGAIAAAIVGRTAAYGMHLDADRLATLRVELRCALRSISDYSALGAIVGQHAHDAVPYFSNLALSLQDPLSHEKLKALGAAMAATGAVSLFHVEGVTPEACAGSMLAPHHATFVVADLAPGYTGLTENSAQVDLIWIGCPHASLEELRLVAGLLQGKQLRLPLWITCARPIRERAESMGLVAAIESAGGQVFADACLAIAPLRDLGYRAVATPSAKGAYYLRNLAGVAARFATLDQCIAAALSGSWEARVGGYA